VVSWGELAHLCPDLASSGRELFLQFGVGLAFLATVRRDGAPRLHPICVIPAEDGLYGLIIPSLKLADLKRDGRYTLHAYPRAENEDAFSVSGHAAIRADQGVRKAAIAAFLAQPGRQGPALDEAHFADQTLVEFLIDSCLLTLTNGHGDPSPKHTVWKAPAN
jgi:Pyridoxamine 5'-phosphate oxidase